VLVLTAMTARSAAGANWPRFRGPNGQGVGESARVPVRWSEDDYTWQVELPGKGHSSPVVWGEKVFVTCGTERPAKGILLCLDAASGRELWRREYAIGEHRMNSLNSYASASPAADAGQVYAVWYGAEQSTLVALGHDGDERWRTKLDGVHARHGLGSSPVVVDDKVIVSQEQDENSDNVAGLWLAFDRNSGREVWRYVHPTNPNASYGTPCVWRDAQGRAQLIFASNLHGLSGLDLADGTLLWQTPSSLPARVCSSPVIAGDRLIGTCGKGGRGIRLAAVKGGEEVYSLTGRTVPYVPTSVYHDGLLFTFHDNGLVSCLRAESGEPIWSEKPAGRYFGSPILLAGRLYAITINGDVVVLAAGPEYKRLAVNPLGEKSHATPAAVDNRLYLRTFSRLIAVGTAK
jgi:outer membrane protein assembly factor BamB